MDCFICLDFALSWDFTCLLDGPFLFLFWNIHHTNSPLKFTPILFCYSYVVVDSSFILECAPSQTTEILPRYMKFICHLRLVLASVKRKDMEDSIIFCEPGIEATNNILDDYIHLKECIRVKRYRKSRQRYFDPVRLGFYMLNTISIWKLLNYPEDENWK